MNSLLPDTAPDFDQPVAVLKHCHGRIRKQLATLEKLLAHLPGHGADEQARQAASAVLKYFEKAAHLHHEDEEQDLIPMLRAVAGPFPRPGNVLTARSGWRAVNSATRAGTLFERASSTTTISKRPRG